MFELLFNFFFDGRDITQWISSKLFMAFLGGLGGYLLKNEYFLKPGETKLSKTHGLVFSFFSAIAGVAMLNPENAANAFAAGLIGVSAMTSFFNQSNKGASEETYIDKALNKKEIEDVQKKTK